MESKLCKRRSDKTKATFENITLTRTGGKHGGGEILAQMGGFWIRIASRKRTDLYIVGDSIWKR
jgi:hypothetical protein